MQMPIKNKISTGNAGTDFAADEEAFLQMDMQPYPKQLESGDSFCICERSYDGKLMFQCDFCENWFHPECLGMSVEEIKAKEQQGEKELWFHSDDCKNAYLKKNIKAKKNSRFAR